MVCKSLMGGGVQERVRAQARENQRGEGCRGRRKKSWVKKKERERERRLFNE